MPVFLANATCTSNANTLDYSSYCFRNTGTIYQLPLLSYQHYLPASTDATIWPNPHCRLNRKEVTTGLLSLEQSTGLNVRKMPSWPISWANFSLLSLCSCSQTSAFVAVFLHHVLACIVWANLTHFLAACGQEGQGGLRLPRRRPRRPGQTAVLHSQH